ncbi:MAG: nuclear transport factor 2 family protein [Actinomycetota bacterium]|nr:nuclear transport factor 2 family protein [Actinomycetota bacterium]
MGAQENKALIRHAFDDWAAGTGSVFSLLAPQATWTIVGPSVIAGTYPSREAFMTSASGPLNARLATPLVPSLRAVYADGDTVIAFFDADATARDGKPYHNTYTWYLQLKDEAIVHVIAFFDSMEVNDLWARVTPE